MNVQVDRNQPRTPATDSRALQNLIKAEKTYVEDLLRATSSAYSAASSLHAWGISETPDLDHASDVVAVSLEAAANAQKTHAQALDQYRDSLKDMLDREQSIRSIVRDRDILMSRVIKMTQRKPTRWEMMKGEEEHQARVFDAQRELHACEQTLANETAALVGVKRRTFKEALAMRAKVLGDTGARMMDCARDILMFLDTFDADIPVAPMPVEQYASRQQQLLQLHPQQYEQEQPAQPEFAHPMQPGTVSPSTQHAHQNVFLADPATLQQLMPNMQQQQQQQQVQQVHMRPHFDEQRSEDAAYDSQAGVVPMKGVYATSDVHAANEAYAGERATSPVMESPVHRSQNRSSLRSKRSSRLSNIPTSSLPTVPGGVPSAPRMNLEHARDGFVAPVVPGGVPTAPRLFTHDDDSDERVAPSTVDSSVAQPRRERHRRSSTEDYTYARPGGRGKRSGGGGFFSRMSNLFRTDMSGTSSAHSGSLLAPMSGTGGGRESPIARRGGARSATLYRRDDSDDEDLPMRRNVVAHVNERPVGHGGGLHTHGASLRTAEERRLDDAIRQSVIGAGIAPGKQSRPSSRQSDTVRTKTGVPSSQGTRRRKPRSQSVDLGAPTAPGTTPVRRVSMSPGSDRMVRTPSGASSTATKPKKKKKDAAASSGAFPPPAPSSFYNPGKFATESWVAKPEQVPSRPASAQGLTHVPPSHGATPLKSAMKKTKRTSFAQSEPDVSMGGISTKSSVPYTLELNRPVDGTGSLGMERFESGTGTPTASASGLAPALSYLQISSPVRNNSVDAETSEMYRAYLDGMPTSSTSLSAQQATSTLPAYLTASSSAKNAAAAPAPVAPAPAPAPAPAAPAPAPVQQAPAPAASAAASTGTSWNTRIGRDLDSSDDEDDANGPGENDYYSARAAFGKSTRHLGLATGAIQPKPEGEKRKKKASVAQSYM